MSLADFDPATVKKFRETFPPYYQCANPMDLTGSAKTEDMLKAGHLALEDPNIDAVVFGLQPIAPGLADSDVMAKQIVEHFGPGKTQKPFVVVEWGGKYPDDRTIRTILKESGMAVYSGAEEALRVLSKLASYQEYLTARKSIHSETYPSIDMTQVNALFNKVANKGRFTLTEVEGYDVFTLCGIKTPAYSLFTNGNEAADFVSRNLASNPSGRFVAKVVSPDVGMNRIVSSRSFTRQM
ncbi:acyl-synthetase [Blastocystis sp. subtype 4]|uniref:acyl-synthetase n=1 Tax=Blastocystis sp. subtype 4 TaxID=944170 RepID=UPI0007114D68|nr:acyl-synthetase [Blastocystis sp. subtype 4]KNB44765.1 acyl-synthetase [Blastocystis sp. subtype 4]|eukprot:XP_014528227.1 acyl-synthetase [Blastocystis sp. subtype 4]